MPPGTGELILYRPLTFDKTKDKAGRKDEAYDDFMRQRVEEEAGLGRSDRLEDGGMEEEILVGREREGPSSDGMEMDLDG